jgi:trans-aconitate methyltransferase
MLVYIRIVCNFVYITAGSINQSINQSINMSMQAKKTSEKPERSLTELQELASQIERDVLYANSHFHEIEASEQKRIAFVKLLRKQEEIETELKKALKAKYKAEKEYAAQQEQLRKLESYNAGRFPDPRTEEESVSRLVATTKTDGTKIEHAVRHHANSSM